MQHHFPIHFRLIQEDQMKNTHLKFEGEITLVSRSCFALASQKWEYHGRYREIWDASQSRHLPAGFEESCPLTTDQTLGELCITSSLMYRVIKITFWF